MDEEIAIINEKTRNEKIKSFFTENKKKLISTIVAFILIILGFYSYQIYQDRQSKRLSEKYNEAIIEHKDGEKTKVIESMVNVIEDKDSTYSPLALYFLIDQNFHQRKTQL